ncbi:MAG: oligosaccharide flippase family protein [Candidatus Eisenbacteria bacterium]|nr:oligosaccharide flippase family protein [Candidatus Eisenbacteria bacterium]
MKTAGQQVSGALLWTIVPRAVQMVVSVFTSVYIVRALGGFDYGTLSVLRTFLALAGLVVGFGFGQALNRFIPELRVQGQHDEGRALLYRCLLVQSGIWVVVAGVLALLRGTIAAHYPTYADPLLLGVLLSILEVYAQTVSQYTIASYRARELAAGTTAGSLTLAFGTAWLLHQGMKVPGVLWAGAIGNAVTLVILLVLLRRSAPKGSFEATGIGRFPWSRLMAYAAPWMPNNLLNYVVWRQSETVFLGLYRTREEAGYFDIAYKLPQLALEFLPSSIYPLILAGFSETATVAKERMPEFLSLYYRLLFFLLAPLSLLGLAMGDRLLVILYGAPMAPAGPYCQAFFVIFTASFIGTPLSMAVYVVERVWLNLLLNVGYASINLGLDLLLIPRYGLLGATIPTALVTVLIPFVRYWVARRYVARIVIPWGFMLKCYLSASPILALFWLKQWAETGAQALLLCLAAALVTVVSYRLCRVLGPEERSVLERSRLPFRALLLRLL